MPSEVTDLTRTLLALVVRAPESVGLLALGVAFIASSLGMRARRRSRPGRPAPSAAGVAPGISLAEQGPG